MSQERIVFLDYAKVFCTFLVVFAHLYSALSPERVFIYAFHMPFFFLVSGMFHKDLPILDSIRTNFRKIIVPTMFYLLVFFVIYGAVNTWNSENYPPFHSALYQLFKNICSQCYLCAAGVFYGNGELLGNGITWFLIVLFYCKIFEDCIANWNICKVAYIVLLVVTILIKPRYFWLGQAIVSFPFYHIGKHYKQKILTITTQRSQTKYLRMSICAILMVALPLINGKVSIYGIHFGYLHFPINVVTFYVCAMVGTMFALDFSSFFTQPNKIISKIATSLLSIVGFQKIFLKLFIDTYGDDHNILISSLISIIIICLCILMHNISIKLFPWIFGKTKRTLA